MTIDQPRSIDRGHARRRRRRRGRAPRRRQAPPVPVRRQRARPPPAWSILGFFGLFAIIGPWIAPYDPSARSNDLLQPPSRRALVRHHPPRPGHLQPDPGRHPRRHARRLHRRHRRDDRRRDRRRHRRLPRRRRRRGLSALSNVFLVIPALPLIIIVAVQLPDGRRPDRRPRHRVHRRGPGAPGCCGRRRCRCAAATTSRRPGPPASAPGGSSPFEILPNLTAIIAVRLRRHGHLRGHVARSPWPSSASRRISDWNWGTILFWAQSQQALPQGAWWWFVPAGLAHRAPRHRAGADQLRHRRVRQPAAAQHRPQRQVDCASAAAVRMRVGFTPVRGRGRRRTAHDPSTEPRRERAAADARRDEPSRCWRSGTSTSTTASATTAGARASATCDLTLHRGEVLGLAGECGSGKSTLAYGVTRLLPPPGRDHRRRGHLPPPRRRRRRRAAR